MTGRVIFLRNTGKLCFVRLREGDGTELQVMLSLADIGEEPLADFKSFVDIGDHLAVSGEVVTSRRGELSIQAHSWRIAAKALRPLPNEHRPLSDEARVRLRYVDMIVRPEARDMVRKRAAVLRSLRASLDGRGFVEVETPVLQLTNGGAAARPFRTRLNAFDQDMLLRIALELDLKKAMVGGVERVYEIGRTFRNEGIDSTHAAEFSMLEAYQAYGDYNTMADAGAGPGGGGRRSRGQHRRHRPRRVRPSTWPAAWRHATLLELVSEAVGEPVTAATDDRRGAAAGSISRRGNTTRVGCGRHRARAVRKTRRAHPPGADVRPRLSGRGQAAGKGASNVTRVSSRRSTWSSTASSWPPPIRR